MQRIFTEFEEIKLNSSQSTATDTEHCSFNYRCTNTNTVIIYREAQQKKKKESIR